MPLPGPTSSPALQKRLAFRLFRLAAAIALAMAMAAIILIVQGKAEGRATALIAMALAIGLFVLIGFAVMTLGQFRKDNNDSRP